MVMVMDKTWQRNWHNLLRHTCIAIAMYAPWVISVMVSVLNFVYWAIPITCTLSYAISCKFHINELFWYVFTSGHRQQCTCKIPLLITCLSMHLMLICPIIKYGIDVFRYMNGAATNPDAHVVAYAATAVKKGLEIGKKLGGRELWWGILKTLFNPNCTGGGGGGFCRACKTGMLSATPLHDFFLWSLSDILTPSLWKSDIPLRSDINLL